MTKLLDLDPKKRFTADQVLSHKWTCGGAKTEQLNTTVSSLKKYTASRKLKKAALGVIAQQKMNKALGA